MTCWARRGHSDESVAKLGYYSQFRDQSITTASIRTAGRGERKRFPPYTIGGHSAEPGDRTRTARRRRHEKTVRAGGHPLGLPRCPGAVAGWAESNDSHYVRSNDAVVNAIKQRLTSALVITEWCRLPNGTDPRSYYEKGLHDVIRYHVSMTSSANFPDRDSTSAMDPKLYLLWAQANTSAGYRYSVEATAGIAINSGQGGDHFCRLDQLRLGGRH